jgi:phospholipid transport system substrate-binding protein
VKRFAILLTGLLCFASVQAADDSAMTLVRNTSDRMLAALEQHRAEIKRNPQRIYGLVNRIVVPHFDFRRITQSAVGLYWRRATAQQRTELTNQFQQMLVRTYATALLDYSGEKIRYLPVRPSHKPDLVTVSTQVQEPGGSPVSIDYRLHRESGEWKVVDISIDNVSLVSNYRSSFASEIRANGIDGLIQRLKDKNEKGQA